LDLSSTGGGSISVVQLTITSFWFKGQQLAFAYGIMLALTRIVRPTALSLARSLAAILVSHMGARSYRAASSTSS